MSKGIVHELATDLQSEIVQSMVLMPAESTAALHVHRLPGDSWSLRLDCRRVMADLVATVVSNSHAGEYAVAWHGHNVDRITVTTDSPRLLERLIGLVVDDHVRTSPGIRMAAILLEQDGCVPRRVEVVRPLRPAPVPAARRPALRLVASTS